MRVKYLNFIEQWKEESRDLLPLINKVLSSGKYIGINTEDIIKFENKVSKICNTKEMYNPK